MTVHANSVEAFHGLTDLPQRQREVLALYCVAIPLTDREVSERLGRELYTVRPRITELVAAGLLVEVGTSKDPVTARTVRTCALPIPH